MTGLPDGWVETTLANLGEWRGGGTPKKSREDYWRKGSIPWVSPKDMKRAVVDRAEDRITESAVQESATRLVPAGSILIVTRSGILQHTLPVATNSVEVAINQDLKALIPASGIDPFFIAAQLRAFSQEILAECSKSGTTVESVNFDKLKARSFLLAPESEQRRIAAKLDQLLGRTALAKREIDRVPVLVAKYKQVILAAAFSGELTRAWREANSAAQPQLLQVRDLVSEMRYGTAKKCSAEPKGTAVLRIPNVTGGRIDLSDLKYAVLSSSDLQQLRLEANDILIVRSNGSVELMGRPSLVTEKEAGLAYAGYLIRLRPLKDLVRSDYLAHMLEAPEIRRIIETGARSTSGVHNINTAELSALRIPVPDLTEQDEILRQLQSSWLWLDKVASEHDRAGHLLPKLEQAILAKAFRGDLVPQDPSDEPASALLERIWAARSAKSSQKRGRKPAPSKPRREKAAMTKSRQNEDVSNKPYLANILRQEGGISNVDELFKKSDLPLTDFYKQLTWEVDKGHIRDQHNKMLRAA